MVNHADDQGRIKANPAYLRSIIFPYDDLALSDIEGWLDQIAANGTITIYTVDRKVYAQFLNWWDYQSMSFAAPSQYPAPEGWCNRIRYTGKHRQQLTYNWTTYDGKRLPDTCDCHGKPLSNHMDVHMDDDMDVLPAQKLHIMDDKEKDKEKEKEKDKATGAPKGRPAPAAAAKDVVFEHWQSNMPGTLTPSLVDQLGTLIEETSAQAVIDGINVAVGNNRRTLAYVRGCAQRYISGDIPGQSSNGRGQSRNGPRSFAQQEMDTFDRLFGTGADDGQSDVAQNVIRRLSA